MERGELYDGFFILQESLFALIRSNENRVAASRLESYAEGLALKCLLHALSIRRAIEVQGEWYSSTHNRSFSYLVDPISITAIVRALYECMLTFNHIFINPTDDKEIELRYCFWLLETTISKAQSKPLRTKTDAQFRKENIAELEATVKYMLNMELVNTLDLASQKIITDKRKLFSDKWTYYVSGSKLEYAGGLHGLQDRLVVNQILFENLYKVFSLQVHPTAYSAYMALTMFDFDGEEPENFKLMDGSINFCLSILSLFIYDYCTYSSEARKEFELLPESNKAVINALLRTYKGPSYFI